MFFLINGPDDKKMNKTELVFTITSINPDSTS